MREGKKIAIVNHSNNKKLIAESMGVNHKNIYFKSKKEGEDLEVKKKIEKTFEKHPAYGHRRLAIELKMNKKKVARIMKKFDLKPPRLWYQKRYLTKPNRLYQNEFENLIGDLESPTINEVWSSDLTYLKYRDRFFYLAAIQDLATNEIVGYNLGDRHDADLVLKTIREAVLKSHHLPKIFHSDRGREFLNEDCVGYLKQQGVQISASDPGSPWQNGHAESFFSRLKSETGDLSRFESLGELAEHIYQYVNYYNHKRIVTRLRMSPVKYKNSLRNCS